MHTEAYYMPWDLEPIYDESTGRIKRLRRVRALASDGVTELPGVIRWTLPVGPDNSALLKDCWLNFSCGGGDAVIKFWLFGTENAGTPQAKSKYISGNQKGDLIVKSDTRFNLAIPANVDQMAVEFVTPSIHIPLSAGFEIDPK